jgi:hypothetical protein
MHGSQATGFYRDTAVIHDLHIECGIVVDLAIANLSPREIQIGI